MPVVQVWCVSHPSCQTFHHPISLTQFEELPEDNLALLNVVSQSLERAWLAHPNVVSFDHLPTCCQRSNLDTLRFWHQNLGSASLCDESIGLHRSPQTPETVKIHGGIFYVHHKSTIHIIKLNKKQNIETQIQAEKQTHIYHTYISICITCICIYIYIRVCISIKYTNMHIYIYIYIENKSIRLLDKLLWTVSFLPK